MARPFPLQTVLELMQTRADEATQQLARLIANERDARNKLEMLQQYRNEYALRFQQASQLGLTPSQWQNYQDFLGRLDDAIESQQGNVRQQAESTNQGRNAWQEKRKTLKAFDTLSERHQARETARELKQDQKAQDEFAARRKDS